MPYERDDDPFCPSFPGDSGSEHGPDLSRNQQPPLLPPPFASQSSSASASASSTDRGGTYPAFGYDFTRPYRHYPSQQPPPPAQHQHQHQYQQSSPSDSLNAALREGTDCLQGRLSFSRLPPLPRPTSTSAQHSNFGYIPEHFFYSPPQSPQISSQPSNTAGHGTTHDSASAGPFTIQPSAGASANQYLGGTSTDQYTAGPPTDQHPAGPSANFCSAGSSSGQHSAAGPSGTRHSSGPCASQHSSAPSTIQPSYLHHAPSLPHANTAGMPSASASTPTSSSRKRQRPSFSDDSIPSATKRRIHVHLDDEDEDEIEELGPDSDLLAKQREELVNKQREESNKTTRIGELNCMICLEHFTNMTATHCGHIFCHECLAQALTASQRSSDHNHGTCPACRKVIKPKGKNQIIPLTLMRGRKKN